MSSSSVVSLSVTLNKLHSLSFDQMDAQKNIFEEKWKEIWLFFFFKFFHK